MIQTSNLMKSNLIGKVNMTLCGQRLLLTKMSRPVRTCRRLKKKYWLAAYRSSSHTSGMYISCAWSKRNVYFPLFPPLCCNTNCVRRGTVMFLWEMSNNWRQAEFKTRLLLSARLFNANCILSRLPLPSFIAVARKISSLFPQFVFPDFFRDIVVSNNRWPQ